MAATAAGVLFLACGGDEAPQEPTVALTETPATGTTRSTDNGVSKLIEKKSPDGKDIYLLAIDAEGVEFEASIGEHATIPSNFPSDVPIIPDSKPMAALSAGSGGTILTLKTSEEQSKIRDYYLSELPKNGWTIDSERNFGGQLMINASKGNRRASVAIAGTSGDSRLSIILSEEP